MSYVERHTVRARFSPHRQDDLREGVKQFIGIVGRWRSLWVMDEDDPFPGEVAYQFMGHDDFWQWVPERDLEVL